MRRFRSRLRCRLAACRIPGGRRALGSPRRIPGTWGTTDAEPAAPARGFGKASVITAAPGNALGIFKAASWPVWPLWALCLISLADVFDGMSPAACAARASAKAGVNHRRAAARVSREPCP